MNALETVEPQMARASELLRAAEAARGDARLALRAAWDEIAAVVRDEDLAAGMCPECGGVGQIPGHVSMFGDDGYVVCPRLSEFDHGVRARAVVDHENYDTICGTLAEAVARAEARVDYLSRSWAAGDVALVVAGRKIAKGTVATVERAVVVYDRHTRWGHKTRLLLDGVWTDASNCDRLEVA